MAKQLSDQKASPLHDFSINSTLIKLYSSHSHVVRVQNSLLTSSTDLLVPFITMNREAIPDFPASPEEIRNMNVAALNSVFQALRLRTKGTNLRNKTTQDSSYVERKIRSIEIPCQQPA